MSETVPSQSRGRKFLRAIFSLGRMRTDERRASINALNIFFGAIIGVNFSSLQQLPLKDYTVILVLTSAVIALILIVANTSRRVWSAVQLFIALAGYYYLVRVDGLIAGVSDYLLVTLGLWALLVIIYEFSGSDDEGESAGGDL
ncbi:hypothetical protein [Erythrobacter sp. EC-HK427]|uniref:hypothetical protein n=1 Tax=Erythrobacter sp. EC-HK427 TaxID=2038396 RepID=UPI001253092A|nr:hypothetical protein [Erythrobacter sp. EC-HK427]VVT02465.1 membrane hypothetical protein [Erythrobacter sp. EC-HK427]